MKLNENIKFDYAKLKDLIISTKMDDNKNYTKSTFAKKIGISYFSLYKKLNNNVSFTQNEIINIAKVLNISNEEIPEYFFKLKVEKTQ